MTEVDGLFYLSHYLSEEYEEGAEILKIQEIVQPAFAV
jgi:hypothetical protein